MVPQVDVEYRAAVGEWTLPKRPRAGGQVTLQTVGLPEQQCAFYTSHNNEVAEECQELRVRATIG